MDFVEAAGEAAFYGPKVDFLVRDVIGRKWQLGTVQLDYVLPERFGLEYTGADNHPHRPVMIHRAPFGSMERFMGILIEHFGGAFPLWLAPSRSVIFRSAKSSTLTRRTWPTPSARPGSASTSTSAPTHPGQGPRGESRKGPLQADRGPAGAAKWHGLGAHQRGQRPGEAGRVHQPGGAGGSHPGSGRRDGHLKQDDGRTPHRQFSRSRRAAFAPAQITASDFCTFERARVETFTIMATQPIGSSSSSTSTSTPAVPSGYNLKPADFIKMMVTQLQNQDPMQPACNSDLLAQMSQIGQLQSSTTLQDSLKTMTLQNHDRVGGGR